MADTSGIPRGIRPAFPPTHDSSILHQHPTADPSPPPPHPGGRWPQYQPLPVYWRTPPPLPWLTPVSVEVDLCSLPAPTPHLASPRRAGPGRSSDAPALSRPWRAHRPRQRWRRRRRGQRPPQRPLQVPQRGQQQGRRGRWRHQPSAVTAARPR